MVAMAELDDVDLSLRLSKEEEQKRLAEGQHRLLQLRLVNGGQLTGGRLGPPVCVVFEGWDASGKGGAIKRLLAPLDPRHVRVASYAAPTPTEKRHHFLWRFYPALPGWGGMAVLDRSWYGRVLVERVEEFATEEQWERAYEEISNCGCTSPTRSSCAGSNGGRPIRSSNGSSARRTGAIGKNGISTRRPYGTC